jgi:hypothetical protein
MAVVNVNDPVDVMRVIAQLEAEIEQEKKAYDGLESLMNKYYAENKRLMDEREATCPYCHNWFMLPSLTQE